MLERFSSIFRIPDLRKRILFTLALLAVYRVGGHIPIPGVNSEMCRQWHVAADLHGNCCRVATRSLRSLGEGKERNLGTTDSCPDDWFDRGDGRGGGVHCLRGTQRAADSRAKRQAHHRAKNDGR